jgi:DNA replication and repair protein RecF
MHILHLSLTNFRNYSRLELDLPAGIIVLQGNNAQGKTNLLEAIYYLSRIRSPRTKVDRELVNWLALEDDLPFARLVAQIQRAEGAEQIELSLVKSAGQSLNSNATVLRKHIRINGANKRVLDAVGLLNAVLFMPQDINLVSGAPHRRRRYLDDTICQMDPQYWRELQEYGRVLTRRNYLLKSLRGQRDDSQLLFWDQRLVEHGAYLTLRRQQVIRQLDEFMQRIHPRLTGGEEQLRLEYCASVLMQSSPGVAYQIPLLAKQDTSPEAEISLRDVAARFADQLNKVRAKELDQGVSIIGPHRDNLRFLVNGVDMNTYGSRGQQRTITLSLKLAEVEWITQEKDDKPVLLLDDVISELDTAHRDCLLDVIDRAQQVIMTTTSLTHYSKEFLERATLWHVRAGRIEDLTLP